jgi:hypothetical protein
MAGDDVRSESLMSFLNADACFADNEDARAALCNWDQLNACPNGQSRVLALSSRGSTHHCRWHETRRTQGHNGEDRGRLRTKSRSFLRNTLGNRNNAVARGQALVLCFAKRFVKRLAATIRHGPTPTPTDQGDHGHLHERGRGTPVGLDRGRRPPRLESGAAMNPQAPPAIAAERSFERMSAFGPKQTSLVAPHMSANDPERTLVASRPTLIVC